MGATLGSIIFRGRVQAGSPTRGSAVSRRNELGAGDKALYDRMSALGPVIGAKLLGRAIDYLAGAARDDHLILARCQRSRTAQLVLATFSYGRHPDLRLAEEGLSINLHVVLCGRSKPRCATDIPGLYLATCPGPALRAGL